MNFYSKLWELPLSLAQRLACRNTGHAAELVDVLRMWQTY